MPLPINIENLIKDRVIEDSRFEYKLGWNPEKVLHTMCAFANDLDNIGGGYILIGIEEENSRPGTVVGVSEEEASKINKEMSRLCNLMSPTYTPVISEEMYEGKRIVVIWVLAGESRPYKCPTSLGKDRTTNENAYYIRRLSNTVRASQSDEIALISISEKRTFDDQINRDASISDIRLALIEDYLERVGSTMDADSGGKDRLLRDLRLVRGPPEVVKPLNIGLMMFNRRPDDFFPYAWIDVVVMPDPTGEGMTERSFKGPIDRQLQDSLDFIRNSIIAERIFKLQDRAEAIRVFNYPYEAIEEAVVNAAYHKDYLIPEQITVTFTPDHVEIRSFPGPDRSISDEAIANLTLSSTHYRNKRLGDYLKELHLAEGRNSGIPKIVRVLKRNGSEPPKYITDPDRTFLKVIIPIHEKFRDKPTKSEPTRVMKKKSRTSEELRSDILEIVKREGCISTKDLCTALGYDGNTDNIRRAIAQLIADERISYLYPDSPRHPKQRICPVFEGELLLRY